MNQIQIQVVDLQVLQRFLQSTFNIFWIVESVPQLRGDEQVTTLNDSFIDLRTDCISNFILISVDESAI